jgi:outer membrane protein W
MKSSLVVPAVVLAAVLAGAPSRAPASPLDSQDLAYSGSSTASLVDCPAYMSPSRYYSSGSYGYYGGYSSGYGRYSPRYYGGYGVYGGLSSGYYAPRVRARVVYTRPYTYSVPYTYMRERYPVRHRPRYHDNDRYDDRNSYEPHYYAALGGGNFDPNNQPGNGFWGNAEIGSEAGQALDLGVRVNWYHRASDRSEVISEFTDPAGNVGQRVVVSNNVETNLIPAMAIARVRFPMSRDFQPYVGGGVGWEWLTVQGTDDSGFTFQDDYDGFGAQLFGGLNVGVSPSMALYGEALWNKSTVKATFYDATVGGDVQDEINLDGLAFHGGLRFRF